MMYNKVLINISSYIVHLESEDTNIIWNQLHWIVLLKRFYKILIVLLSPILTEFMTT